MRALALATGNAGKVRELRDLLGGLPLRLIPLSELPDVGPIHEDRDSFEGNAHLKALTVAQRTGLPALADDSGLVVDALGGAPGVRSARYAGEGATDAQNRRRLLSALGGVADPARTARFVAALAVVDPEGETLATAQGRCEGRILTAERGSGGFGYDSLFVPEGGHQTLAELDPGEKHALSHRGEAIRALIPWLTSWSQGG